MAETEGFICPYFSKRCEDFPCLPKRQPQQQLSGRTRGESNNPAPRENGSKRQSFGALQQGLPPGATYGATAMDTNIASARYGKAKRATQIGISATTFLTLCVWIGPNAACWLIAIAAIVTGWVLLAHRLPVVGWLTYVFFNSFVLGLISGLFGYRGGYGYYSYRPRYRL